jgi:hypothetical protein
MGGKDLRGVHSENGPGNPSNSGIHGFLAEAAQHQANHRHLTHRLTGFVAGPREKPLARQRPVILSDWAYQADTTLLQLHEHTEDRPHEFTPPKPPFGVRAPPIPPLPAGPAWSRRTGESDAAGWDSSDGAVRDAPARNERRRSVIKRDWDLPGELDHAGVR